MGWNAEKEKERKKKRKKRTPTNSTINDKFMGVLFSSFSLFLFSFFLS